MDPIESSRNLKLDVLGPSFFGPENGERTSRTIRPISFYHPGNLARRANCFTASGTRIFGSIFVGP